MAPPMLLVVLATVSIAAGLSDAAVSATSQLANLRVQFEHMERERNSLRAELESRADKPWDNKLRQQAHEIAHLREQLRTQKEQLSAQISSLSQLHENKNRALLYKVEKLRPRAEFAESVQAEVLSLRAENETRGAREAKLGAELRKKSELLHTANETVQKLRDELHELRGMSEERTRMYSELSDKKNKADDQYKVQIRNKDREIRELRLFKKPSIEREECRILLQELRSIDGTSDNLVSEHESPNPAEMGWKNKYASNFVKTHKKEASNFVTRHKKELAKDRIRDSSTLRRQLSDLITEEADKMEPEKKTTSKKTQEKNVPINDEADTVEELGSATGAKVVEFSKTQGVQKRTGNAKRKVKKIVKRQEKEHLKGEQRAQHARESLHSKSHTAEAPKPVKDELWNKGMKWLSQVYRNKQTKVEE